MDENLHHVVVTGIVVKNGKYLITKRSLNKKNFPGKWTVPGGNLELKDYSSRKKDTNAHWYNVLENVLKREIKEEVGLDVKNIGYITSMTFVKPDKTPTLIISLFVEYNSGDVVLNDESIDYKWIDISEAKNYDLIEGIYEELVMLDRKLKGEKVGEWGK